MTTQNFALPVRPGEHACCRFADADDRERIASAFVADGLQRGHKVVYVCDNDDPDAFAAELSARDERVAAAVQRGQLVVRPARETYRPGGVFDPDHLVVTWREEHRRMRAEGYPALSLTGEMNWALRSVVTPEELRRYERSVAELMEHDGSLVFLCQYDHGRFAAGALAEAAEAHEVDVSPELAAIGRDGCLSAARVGHDATLRLSGELDFDCSETLAAVLDAHYHGDLRLDLADLRFVDVAGLRALRGRKGQRLRIQAASEPVRRLIALLAWDSDPAIELAELAAAA
jgi:ABC-type transporter Mla MlaB component